LKSNKIPALSQLHKAFSQNAKNAEVFIRSDGLPVLTGCFFGQDSDVLHLAAWCVINLTAVYTLSKKQVKTILPVLIQYCQSSDTTMQDLCAWAIGNLAAESDSNRELMIQQGCIPSLLKLVVMKEDFIYDERTHSILFALTNFSRGSYPCIRHLQSNNVMKTISTMLENLDIKSEASSQLGYFINNIYIRKENWKENRMQYSTIINLIIHRITVMLKSENANMLSKEIFPYIRCLGNILGFSNELSVEAGDQIVFHEFLSTTLLMNDLNIKNEILWLIFHFIADPSCCCLAIFQENILENVMHLCQHNEEDISYRALRIIERSCCVSEFLSKRLVNHGVVKMVLHLISSPLQRVSEKALDILLQLAQGSHLQGEEQFEIKASLEHLICPDLHENISRKATDLHSLINQTL